MRIPGQLNAHTSLEKQELTSQLWLQWLHTRPSQVLQASQNGKRYDRNLVPNDDPLTLIAIPHALNGLQSRHLVRPTEEVALSLHHGPCSFVQIRYETTKKEVRFSVVV